MAQVIGVKVDTSVQNQKAQEKVLIERGISVFQSMLAFVKSKDRTMTMFLIDILNLDMLGRKAFVDANAAERKKQNAYVKSLKGTPEHAAWKAIPASAMTRISEAVTFCKAVDMGYTPVLNDAGTDTVDGYAAVVCEAREFLRQAGAGSDRGPKKTTFEEKLKAFLHKEKAGIEQLKAASTLVGVMLATASKPVELPTAADINKSANEVLARMAKNKTIVSPGPLVRPANVPLVEVGTAGYVAAPF